MSWSTAEQVARLIQAARLDATVDPASRKSADLALLDLFDNAINIGDSLVSVTVNLQWPFALRFNAVLALEALFTQQGWREGHKFSDKDAALVALTQLVLEGGAPSQAKFYRTVVGCVCAIAVLDFPTDQWHTFIEERTGQAMAHASASTAADADTPAWTFLHQLSRLAYRNAALWWHLSGSVAAALLVNGLPTAGSAARLNTMAFVLHLLQRRPRPSEENEMATAQNCLLLSRDFSAVVGHELTQCAATIATEARSAGGSWHLPDSLAWEWCLLSALAQRLMRAVEVADAAFRACAVVLVTLQPRGSSDTVHAGGGDSVPEVLRELGGATENCLECILNALQTFPEVSASSSARDLLGCLLSYMVDEADQDGLVPEASDLEALLKDLLSDEETVPLGCEGGDDASIACSVLELFLDANHAQLYEASVTLLDFAKSQLAHETLQPAAWRALSRALTSIARVCEAADISFVDALPQEHVLDLLGTFSTALARQSSVSAACLLLFALSKSFALGGPPVFLSGWHDVLCGAFDAWSSRAAVDPAELPYILGTLLWCVSNAFQSRADLAWLGGSSEAILLQWRVRSLQVLWRTQSTLLVSSVGHVFLQLARVTPFSPVPGDEWSAVCQACVRVCSVKAVSSLLKDVLWACVTLEVSAAAGPSTAGEPAARDCPGLAQAVNQAVAELESARAALVLRALAAFTTELVRVYRSNLVVLRSFDAFLYACALTVMRVCSTDEAAIADEANCRSFACALSAVVMALPLEDTAELVVSAYDSTARVTVVAQAACCGFATLHTLGAALSLQAMAHPSLLGRPSTLAVLNAVFGATNWFSAQRPIVGFTGCTLLLSLWVLDNPARCIAAAAEPGAPGPGAPQTLTSAAFGWWASLAVFSDQAGVVFFLAAAARLLACLSGCDGPAVLSTLATPLRANTVYLIPSFRTRKPTHIQCALSVWASLACGLVLVHRKWTKTVKVPSNEALALSSDITPSAWLSLRRELANAGLPVPSTSSDASALTETAALLLHHMSSHGLSEVVGSAQQLIQ